MSQPVQPGPRQPGRVIFVTTAAVASVTGLVTGDVRAFMLALLGTVLLLGAGYALLRRLLGWRPLRFDDLFHLVGILHP